MSRLGRAALLAASLSLAGCGFSDASLKPEPVAQAAPPAAAPKPAAAPAPAAPLAPAKAAPAPETRRPFVVIRFEQADPDYAQALYEALSGALARRPSVAFDLVAVTRNADDAKRDLASVMHTVAAMGMPADRLSLSSVAASDDATNEVWIYLR